MSSKLCLNCNLETTNRKFCSRSCAATVTNKARGPRTEEEKRKISKSLTGRTFDRTIRKYTRKPKIPKICPICKKEFIWKRVCRQKFCSRACVTKNLSLRPEFRKQCSNAGRKSAEVQKKRRRSKNEKYMAQLCAEEWEILTNDPIFDGWDADIIIPELELAILWNGKWHYQKITKKHSVKQVQNRDKLKVKAIENCGYTPYVIKDMGKFSKEFVETEFLTLYLALSC